MARPTQYSKEIGDRICGEIARGTALDTICQSDEALPTARTVYTWLREHREFLQNYELSKCDQADLLAEQILVIADDPALEPADKRIRVDARKWLASKFKPKKYGDRFFQEISEYRDYSAMSDEELERRLTELQTKINSQA